MVARDEKRKMDKTNKNLQSGDYGNIDFKNGDRVRFVVNDESVVIITDSGVLKLVNDATFRVWVSREGQKPKRKENGA